MYKIGFTIRAAEDRAWEIYLGSTGVPAPVEFEYTSLTANCAEVERQVHEELSGCRENRSREFFNVRLEDAIQCIEKYSSAPCIDVGGRNNDKLLNVYDCNPLANSQKKKTVPTQVLGVGYPGGYEQAPVINDDESEHSGRSQANSFRSKELGRTRWLALDKMSFTDALWALFIGCFFLGFSQFL